MSIPGDCAIVITCEHGGKQVPAPYKALFAGHRALLESHRGHDAGAARLAIDLGAAFGVVPHIGRVSRLIIELNRSLHHPRLFSAITRDLPAPTRARIIAQYWLPHRTAVEREIAEHLRRGRRVIHIAAHSFTPMLDGIVRRADVGLLYDPSRAVERALCERWAAQLGAGGISPPLRVRRNYPYRGVADGLTTSLRRRFGAPYAGVELEVNQAWVADAVRFRHLRRRVVAALACILWPDGPPFLWPDWPFPGPDGT